MWTASAQDAVEKPVEVAQPSGIYFQYALYYAPKPEGDGELIQRANQLFHENEFDRRLTYRSAVVKFTPGNYVEFRQVDPSEYAPPGVDYLKHKGFGLTETERERVQKTSAVLVLDFFIVAPRDYHYLRAANELAALLAQETGGFVWDEETRELYSVAAWRLKRLASEEIFFANTSMHGYVLPSNNYRSVTFGMRKLGLPDLVLAEFPKAFWEPLSEMMQFLVAHVGIQGPLKPKTAWGAEELRVLLGLPEDGEDIPALVLTEAPRDDGDPRNDLLTVDFRKFSGESYQEKQLHAISRLFRPEGDLLELWGEREKLLELSEAARTALAGKRGLVEKGLPKDEQLLVKVFTGEEYVWLRVEDWKADTLEGVRVPDVTASGDLTPEGEESQRVEFNQVFDYLHIKADGSEEGNETGKWIKGIRDRKSVPASGSEKRSASESK